MTTYVSVGPPLLNWAFSANHEVNRIRHGDRESARTRNSGGLVRRSQGFLSKSVSHVESLRVYGEPMAVDRWTEDQERAAATYLQEQTAIASFGLCLTFVRGMVRAAAQVGLGNSEQH